MSDIDKFEKVNYVPLEEEPLSWYEWFFGRSEPEIEADPKSKDAKFKVTEQIKLSANSHALMNKPQKDTPFPHTQSVIQTEDKQVQENGDTETVPKTKPQVPAKKKLHPSMAQLRKKGVKDDLHI